MLRQLCIYDTSCIEPYPAVAGIIIAIYLRKIGTCHNAAIKHIGLLHIQSVRFPIIFLGPCCAAKHRRNNCNANKCCEFSTFIHRNSQS